MSYRDKENILIRSATVDTLLQRPAVRQFAKFCIIGFSSMIIDIGGLFLLKHSHGLHLLRFSSVQQFQHSLFLLKNASGLHWILAQIVSFVLAVSNGYYWNSRWTFKGKGTGKHHEMYVRFMMVNIVGLSLNLSIIKIILIVLTGHLIQHGNPSDKHLLTAKLPAIAIVTFWNFIANKKWTFTG